MIRPLLPLSVVLFSLGISPSWAAVSPLDFTVNTSETVVVDTTNGTPSINLDVGGVTRQAVYQSGSNSNALVFRYTPVAGDVDLDGVALGSAINPNSGLLRDTNGNAMTNFTVTPPSTPNVKINYPSLSMDFVADADGRYTLDGTAYDTLATFLSAAGGSYTRSSIGTYFDSSGVLQTASSGTPRFDHDPITHAAKGILIEEARTNSIYPSLSGTGGWGTTNLVYTANSITSPDGTNNATTITDNSTSGVHQAYTLNISFTSGNTYTFSSYFKAGTATIVQMSVGVSAFSGAGFVNFNLSSGAVAHSGGTIAGSGIQNIGNGWYRCWFSATATSTASTGMGIYLVNNTATAGRSPTYSGSSQYLYHFGAQAEQSAYPTSYIPTTTTSVSRGTDQLYLATASIPSWSTTVGTWTAEYYRPTNTSSTPFIVYASGGAEMITDRSTSVGTWNGSNEVNVSGNPSIRKFASAFDGTGRYLSLNGVTNSGAGTYNIATDNRIYIAGSSAGSRNPHSQISKIKYYPLRVADTQLQLLTQ